MKKNLETFTPDAKNANLGTERGAYMIHRSLEKLGAGRSIVVDKNGQIIAGNKTWEAAVELGLEGEVIRTNGNQLVIVQRTDLDLSDDDGPARELAIADNRTCEVNYEPDMEIVTTLYDQGLLDDYYTAEEIKTDPYAPEPVLVTCPECGHEFHP